MDMPKGFLFDFDGVVVDSFNAHFSAWSNAYKDIFNKTLGDFPHECEGKSPMLIAEFLCKEAGDILKKETLYNLKREYLNTGKVAPTLMPGVIDFEDYIQKNQIPYGIASNATKDYLKNSIQQLGLKFETYFGFEDYQNPKPNPEPYIKLATKLGFTKKDFKNLWVFEDSLPGATAAIKGGMTAIGIESQHTKEELEMVGCTFSFKTPQEALNFIIKTTEANN